MRTQENNIYSEKKYIFSIIILALFCTALLIGLIAVSNQKNEVKVSSTDPFDQKIENIDLHLKALDKYLQVFNGSVDNENEFYAYINKAKESKFILDNCQKQLNSLNEDLGNKNVDFSARLLDYQRLEYDFGRIYQEMTELGSLMSQKYQTDPSGNDLMSNFIEEKNLDPQNQFDLKALNEEYAVGYVLVGDKEMLMDLGAVQETKGFMGFGKKTEPNSNPDKEPFVLVNTHFTDRIPINSTQAELITSHPESSYQIYESEEEVAYLKITDKELFWEDSPYLIIETSEEKRRLFSSNK